MTNITLSQCLSSQVIKSIQGRSLRPLSGPPGGEGFPNGQPEPPHLPCVWPLPLFTSSGTTKKSLALSSLYLLFRQPRAAVQSPFGFFFTGQNDPSSLRLSHTTPWPWWQPSAGPVPLFHCPLKHRSQRRDSGCRPTSAGKGKSLVPDLSATASFCGPMHGVGTATPPSTSPPLAVKGGPKRLI